MDIIIELDLHVNTPYACVACVHALLGHTEWQPASADTNVAYHILYACIVSSQTTSILHDVVAEINLCNIAHTCTHTHTHTRIRTHTLLNIICMHYS